MAGVSKDKVVLPARPFLFTVDQVASMLGLKEMTMRVSYIYYEGRSTGVDSPHKLTARNIATPGLQPEWRITEAEVHRWMKLKGYRLVDRGYWL